MLELNQVYEGDCLEVMAGIEDQSIDRTGTADVARHCARETQTGANESNQCLTTYTKC